MDYEEYDRLDPTKESLSHILLRIGELEKSLNDIKQGMVQLFGFVLFGLLIIAAKLWS